MENHCKPTLPMHTLLLCSDVQFLGITRNVLGQIQITPKIVGGCEEAQALIDASEFDVIIFDWRQVDNLADFLNCIRRSALNPDCVLVAIVRDLLDLRQAFAAGVHFLIHKPASEVQIERCLRAAYCATVARRRKRHREPVNIVAALSSRTQPFAEVIVVNLTEGGAGLRLRANDGAVGAYLNPGEEVDLRFDLPGSMDRLHPTGTVVWATADHAGIRFTHICESERATLEHWLTGCVERLLAEVCERMRAACA